MVKLAMLNGMASKDFVESLDIQKSWGIEMLDLKDNIFGKAITDLTVEEAKRAAELIDVRGMKVYCMSTQIYHMSIEKSEQEFRDKYFPMISRAIEVADILRPTYIRLLPGLLDPEQVKQSIPYIQKNCPWLFELYRIAIDRITEAGHAVVIENEYDSIFGNPDEILEFFEILDRPDKVHFTYDVQNLWQMGNYPSLELYRKLKPITVFFHVKGGQQEQGSTAMKWKSTLEDASWPIAEITRQVVLDGISPVICLNPSHGERKEGYDYDNLAERDLTYMKKLLADIQ